MNNKGSFQHLLGKNNMFIDDFWNDCFTPKKKIIPKTTNVGKKDKRENKVKSLNETKKRNCNSQKIIPKLLKTFYQRHPEIYQEEANNKERRQQSKQAEMRCKNMYEYAKSQQMLTKNVSNEVKERKIKNEMEQCTWKPKINQLTKKQKAKLSKIGVDIYEREKKINFRNKYKKLLESKSKEEEVLKMDNDQECSFQPKLNSSNNFDKMFNKTCLDTKGHYEFLIRYRNAREEHIQKRNKILSFKELSDENSFISGTEFKNSKTTNTSFDSKRIKSQIHTNLFELVLDKDDIEE